jgi:cytochrome c oxidase subunit II
MICPMNKPGWWTRNPVLLLLLLPLAGQAASDSSGYDQALARRPDIANGQKLFAACAVCHGADGSGMADGTVPAIAGQHWQVLNKLLLDFRYLRRWDLNMMNNTATDHLRGPQEIADVVAYANSLPPQPARGTGTGEHRAQGAAVYARLCVACHGAAAQGDGPKGYPRLAGQQYGYLVRQIQQAIEGRRRTFSSAHVQLLKPLTAADIQAIADYLSGLDPA